MAKYPTFLLKGTTKYARFWEPDSVSGKFQSTVIVENDEAAQAVIETIKEVAADQHPKDFKAGKVGLNHSVTDEGLIAFKLRTSKRPRLVDTRGNDITEDPKLGDGSVVKVKGIVMAGGFGAAQKRSVLLIPNAVMIVSLERYRGADDFGDDDIEDGFVSVTSSAKSGTRDSEIIDDMNDEIPEPRAARRNIDF